MGGGIEGGREGGREEDSGEEGRDAEKEGIDSILCKFMLVEDLCPSYTRLLQDCRPSPAG